MRAIIVGGGIGGLVCAIKLQNLGIEATVFEQTQELKDVGAGIQLAPNATRILARLGLADVLASVAVQPTSFELRRWDDGRILMRHALGQTCLETYGAPYYHVARPDLLRILVRALAPGQLQLGYRLSAFEQDGRSITAKFENGTQVSGDILIGADGIHSAARTQICGTEAPHFSGYIAYRGLVPIERLKHLELPTDISNFVGPDRHFVRYRVAGGRLVNFVAVVPARDWCPESWSATGDVDAAVEEFRGWHSEVQGVIGGATTVFRVALNDRDPLKVWGVGRATLLGDAAHAMLPFLAQGACQAIEDVAVLCRCLIAGGEQGVADAIRQYQGARVERVHAVQARSRESAVLFHLPDGPAQMKRDDSYRTASSPPRNWIFDHDADAVTDRAM